MAQTKNQVIPIRLSERPIRGCDFSKSIGNEITMMLLMPQQGGYSLALLNNLSGVATAKCVTEIMRPFQCMVSVRWSVGVGSVWLRSKMAEWHCHCPCRRNGNIKFVLDQRILCEIWQRISSACSGCSNVRAVCHIYTYTLDETN